MGLLVDQTLPNNNNTNNGARNGTFKRKNAAGLDNTSNEDNILLVPTAFDRMAQQNTGKKLRRGNSPKARQYSKAKVIFGTQTI